VVPGQSSYFLIFLVLAGLAATAGLTVITGGVDAGIYIGVESSKTSSLLTNSSS